MLYGADNKPIEVNPAAKEDNGYEHIPSFNFPPPTPKPDWFDRKLLELGGYVPGTEIPKYRVVWGMEEKHFAMGGMKLKYVSIIDTVQTTVGYNIVNVKTGKKSFMKPQEAHNRFMDPHNKQMIRNVKPGELIIPVVTEEEHEIGLPLWMAEYYMEPEGFGSEESWESNRYLVNPQNKSQTIDVLGPYPKQGAYLEWFAIHGYDENGKVEYKPLDEDAFEMFRANHVLNVARKKNFAYDTIEKRKERREERFESDWAEFDRELTTEILDVKANRKYSISPKG